MNRMRFWVTVVCVVGILAMPAFALQDEEEAMAAHMAAVRAAIAARQGASAMPPGAVPPGMPAAAIPGAAPVPGAPTPSPEEIARFKAYFESLTPLDQAEMTAYYRDLGFDLDALLGIGAVRMAQANRARQIMEVLRSLDFSRQPQVVLEARSRLGLGEVPHPDAERASPSEMARWIHLQFTAGEWDALREFLAARPAAESQMVYAGVLQSIKPNAALLPEEVLALAEASPQPPSRPQIQQLAALLRQAAARHATVDVISRLRSDSRYFGLDDSERRQRTIDLLTGAGLLKHAVEYLPPLDEVRAAGDGRLMLAHAAYRRELADKLPAGVEADEARLGAWELMSEISLMDKVPFDTRRAAMQEAVALMPRMPRPLVLPWLERVFASETLGPAALEAMAAAAARVGDASRDAEERARTIVALKEAVDMLLARQSPDSLAFRVPLRMLTTALVTEMENAVTGSDQARQQQQPWMPPQPVSRDVESLARAIPSPAWLDAIEPSLASRAAAACIAVATTIEDTDLALALLRDATRRSPGESERLATAFLARWEQKLRPRAMVNEDMYYFYTRWNMNPAAPLTRGRQRRNMERLRDMVMALRDSGVDVNRLPRLAGVFQACHGVTEVYEREDVERVFGPIESMPPAISIALAQVMMSNLGGDWRDRAVHRREGVKRTDAEIAALVDRGYDLTLALMDSALSAQPESWRLAAMKSAIAYDRQRFLEERRETPSGKLEDVRLSTFAAFEEAAQRYAHAVAAGEEREDVEVFLRWFGVAMGSPGLVSFRAEDVPAPSDAPDDPVERLRRSISALPPESASRHVAEFARAVTSIVGRADASVKPKLVRHALRIVGDHPAGAGLRALDTLYHDLVRDEIRLRLTVDGDDRVGTNEPFGVMFTLRCTASVERETGGFAKYLQTSVPMYTNGRYEQKNYRELLEKGIREAFGKGFELQAISFFDPFIPARGVVEDGQEGWLEKPFAYLVVRRLDPSVDRLPSIPLEMQFSDSTGPVTLVASSNAPALGVGEARSTRPCPDLAVLQVVDARDVGETGESEIRLEVRMRGKGVVPTLTEALDGLEDPLEGYRADLSTARETPMITLGDDQSTTGGMFFYGPPKPPKGGYPEADEHGIYRPTLERSWTIVYRPAEGSATGDSFRLPTLRRGVDGTLESREYADMDIVAVDDVAVSITARGSTWGTVAMAGAGGGALLAAFAGAMWVRRRGRPVDEGNRHVALPSRITPMSTVTALRRLRRDHAEKLGDASAASLEREIARLESHYFGRDGAAERNGGVPSVSHGSAAPVSNGEADLAGTLRRWADQVERK